ncbi:hypothetical protein lbkm_1008 [Lachnospiraceae bacterium KM106-2]|nr:hypothetical protein lbkm_1008 [Lachnospiraceae bacterium KM106-2]
MKKKLLLVFLILLMLNIGCYYMVSETSSYLKERERNYRSELLDENLSLVRTKIKLEFANMLTKITNESNMSDLIDLLNISKENMLNGAGDQVNMLKNKYNEMLAAIADDMDYLIDLRIINKDGLVYSSVHPETVGSNQKQFVFYKDIAYKKQEMAINSRRYSEQEPLITVISAPILRDTVGLGILAAMVDSSFYTKMIQSNQLEHTRYYIVNEQNRIIYASDEQRIGTPYRYRKGEFIREAKISKKDFRLIAEQDDQVLENEIQKPLDNLYMFLGIIGIGSIIIFLSFVYYEYKKSGSHV